MLKEDGAVPSSVAKDSLHSTRSLESPSLL